VVKYTPPAVVGRFVLQFAFTSTVM